jgi:hypothetical protein
MSKGHSRGFSASRLAVTAVLSALLWFTVALTVRARFFRATRVMRIGSDWGNGYIVMPQRAGMPPQTRKAQSDRAALLARQRGLAIVADGNADHVSVIQKARN